MSALSQYIDEVNQPPRLDEHARQPAIALYHIGQDGALEIVYGDECICLSPAETDELMDYLAKVKACREAAAVQGQRR